MKLGVLFGTFDGLHEGHRFLLQQAKEHVDRLVVILPDDESVMSLKGHAPKYTWEFRRDALRRDHLVDDVVLGDREIGSYVVLQNLHPDVVLFGYDQDVLKRDFLAFVARESKQDVYDIITLTAHRPERYKSSKIHSYD